MFPWVFRILDFRFHVLKVCTVLLALQTKLVKYMTSFTLQTQHIQLTYGTFFLSTYY